MAPLSPSSNPSSNTWVFGYGSLIWRPGFPYLRAEKAVLHGVHRRLCVLSYHHRGTRERPGLVFGLERGGSCVGMAFEVAAGNWETVHDYLRAREQVTMVYREALRPARLADGSSVTALAFVADPGHAQYAGRLSIPEQLALVRDAAGDAGPNRDYVVNTAAHLREMGIFDRQVAALSALLENDG